MLSVLFIVRPGGASFETEIGNGFYEAHLSAARQAATKKIVSWVVRSDTGEKRYGFGPGAIHSPACVLRRVMEFGLSSYWDFGTESWVPLPEIETHTERYAQLENT